MHVNVKIENLDRTIEVEPGQNLRSALLDNDIEVYTFRDKILNCRGKGLCGTCRIEVVEGPGLSDASLYERIRVRDLPNGRLACQTRCYQDAVIRTLITPAAVEY